MLALKMQIKNFHIGEKNDMGRKMKRYCFLVLKKWKAANQQNPWLWLRENLLFLSIFVVILMNKKSLFKKKGMLMKKSFHVRYHTHIQTRMHTLFRAPVISEPKAQTNATQKTHIKCALFLITHPYRRSSLEFCMNCLVCKTIVCVYDAQIAWHTPSIWWEISIEVLPFRLLNGKFLIWYADIYIKCPLYIAYQRNDPQDHGNRIWNMSRNSILIPFIRQNELIRLGKSIILRVCILAG